MEGKSPYLARDVPVEFVAFMAVTLTTARGLGTVCTDAQREPAQVELLGAQPFPEGNQPHSPSQNHTPFTCPLCPRETTHQGTAASVIAHQREVHPEEGISLLKKLGRPLQGTRHSNRYGICDLPTNLSRHSSVCVRTPSGTIPPHADRLGGEPFARNPVTPSTPAAQRFNQSKQSSPSSRLPWGIEGAEPMLGALDGKTLARMSLREKSGSAGAPNALCPHPESCATHCFVKLTILYR